MKINEIFEKCLKITTSKRQDYTTNPEFDAHENFKRSAEIASWFNKNEDKSYAVLIGTKLARLGSLLSTERAPNNESIDDTFLDLINYCALWMERRSKPTVQELDEILNKHFENYSCANCSVIIPANCSVLIKYNSTFYQDQRHGNKKFCSIKCLDFDKD